MSDTKRGKLMKAKHGENYFKEMGSRGGRSNVEAMGTDHMREIGKRGGAALKKRRGRDHFVAIGHKSAEARGL